MPPSPRFLRRAFADELPGFEPDEAVWDHIALTFLDGDDASSEALADICEPFFISLKVAAHQDDVRRFCENILRRMKAFAAAKPVDEEKGGAQVQGLSEWLERLKLMKYEEAALRWCEENGAVDIQEIRDNWQSFADELSLKKLERQRVERDAASAPLVPALPVVNAADEAPLSLDQKSELPVSRGKPFGDTRDPYYLLEEIGSGATATVHRCCRGDKVFAVKCIGLQRLKLQANFSMVREKLHRETHILFSLQHSNIVAMYDVHETADKLYLVMEFVRGGELFDYIVHKQFMQEPEAKYVFLQLKDALQYMHGRGVVHRDLKPENILVNDADSREGWPSVKISDFGHSKLINDGLSVAITRVGTPVYWAPEVSDADQASKGYDCTVDLWSLGVVLYVMLEGCYPLYEENQIRTVTGQEDKIENQTKNGHVSFRPTSSSSNDARDVITRFMQVKPKERLTLELCGKHVWLKGCASMVMDVSSDPKASRANEERLQLPRELPNRGTRLRRDLEKFATENKVLAVLATDKTKTSETKSYIKFAGTSVVRERLMGLLEEHFPGEGFGPASGCSGLNRIKEGQDETPRAQPQAAKSISSRRSFSGLSSNLIQHILRVGHAGAGLELVPEMNGMRVIEIDPEPGQPGMRVNDLIVKINKVALAAGTTDEVQGKFGRNFANGAVLSLRRN